MIRVTQVDSEEKLLEMENFTIYSVFSFLKEKLNETYVNVDLHANKTCIKVHVNEADTHYSVILARGKSHLKMIVLLFVQNIVPSIQSFFFFFLFSIMHVFLCVLLGWIPT